MMMNSKLNGNLDSMETLPPPPSSTSFDLHKVGANAAVAAQITKKCHQSNNSGDSRLNDSGAGPPGPGLHPENHLKTNPAIAVPAAANNVPGGHNHPISYLNNEKKFKSYKLISDPCLKKGAPKLYRYDGITSSKDLPLKDPRPHVQLLWGHKEPLDLEIPRFKIDKNYVGIPPAIEVSITNLNDNINKTFLEDTLKKFGALEEIEIFYHPKTKKHLGLAKIVFMEPEGAEACVIKLDQTSLMGNIINVFFDPFAKNINIIYETMVNPPSHNLVDNNFIDPNNLDKSLSLMARGGEYSYMSNEFGSIFPADQATFDSQFYSTTNLNVQQFYDPITQTWKTVSFHPADSGASKSPVRESLETRINNLLRHNRVGVLAGLMNDVSQNSLSLPHLIDASNNDAGDDFYSKKNAQKKIDDSDAILGTPPSPFVSASEYLKWHGVTKEIDQNLKNGGQETGKTERYQDTDPRNATSKTVNDDDDDRMSLSSLSSGEKFEDSVPSMVFDPMSMLGAKFGSAGQTATAAAGFNSVFPSFVYNSFVQNASQPFGYFAGFQVPSDLNECSRQEELSLKERLAKSNKEMLKELLADTAKASIKDLKEILRKDIYKRIVENFSFKMFDQWWEESERKYKSNENGLENGTGDRSPMAFKKAEIHIPFFNNPIFENSMQNRHQGSLATNFEYGLSRGLRAAMGKIPHFKRKVPKPKSPTHLDDKLSNISDDEDHHIGRRSLKRRPTQDDYQRRRRHRRRSVSSQSSSSSSSSSSSESRSRPSSSEHSSDSGSSSSSDDSSSSSLSDDEEEEDSSAASSSAEEDESESESESSAASVVATSSPSHSTASSSKSKSSSSSSKLSRISKKSQSSTALSISTDAAVKEGPKSDRIEKSATAKDFDSDSSGTCTAEETLEELKKENGDSSGATFIAEDIFKNIKTRAEFEGAEALISLASGFVNSQSAPPVPESPVVEEPTPLRDPVLDLIRLEHSYSRPPYAEKPKKVPKPRKTPAPKATTKKERKRKVPTIDHVDENVAPNILSVASEWRKAKRKAMPTGAGDVHFPIDNFKDGDVDDKKLLSPAEPVPEPITFAARDLNAERELMFEFLRDGIDGEDIGYLKRCYTQMIQEEISLPWLNDIHWVDHPATNVPAPKKRRRTGEDPGTRVHTTGCARSEGYYKLNRMEKMHHRVNLSVAGAAETGPASGGGGPGIRGGVGTGSKLKAKQVVTTQQLTREARSNQRRLLTLVDPGTSLILADLLKLNQLKFRKKQLKFARSRIHDWGLFALEKIPPDEMVIEYIGQQVRPMVAEVREKKYSHIGIGSSYLFKIDSDTIIDATRCGNVARFINHSCNPNCYAKVITVEGQKRIVIYSKQVINVGDEITYDYKFPIEENNKIPCLCRTAQCRGYLN